jgi:predicted HTH transcriptional regulator
MTTAEELRELLKQDEGLTLEFKDSRILADSLQLAKTFTAFANAEGGTLLIGIKDDKSIEGMQAKKGHEEDKRG